MLLIKTLPLELKRVGKSLISIIVRQRSHLCMLLLLFFIPCIARHISRQIGKISQPKLL